MTRAVQASILERIAAGDSTAVSLCIDLYAPRVLALARRMGLDESRAEDAVQEIFTDLWRYADRFDPERASEATFVTTVARRRLIDQLRRSERQPRGTSIEYLELAAQVSELTSVDQADEAARAAEALSRLREEERRVLVLSIREGLTHTEIAAETGMPLGTVKSHLRRGLEQVRNHLGVHRPDTGAKPGSGPASGGAS